MITVDFYQLSRDPAETVAVLLAAKTLAAGHRMLIVSADRAQRMAIDAALWNAPADQFLAHGLAGDGDEAMQPILLSDQLAPDNGARYLLIADGVWRDAGAAFERIFYLFPPSHVDDARGAWRMLSKAEGVEPRYWRQDGGKWRRGP